MAPMTFIVTIGMIVSVFAAVAILIRAFGQSDANDRPKIAGNPRQCPKCDQRNKKRAKFCAHCGEKLR
ncbi:MAG: hypothetical protein DHS20C16_31940 [Phycisphaerae bacterium]|nr:MAG: hypothetical protein DHS20C16_31940 [Phycisphaerae bacterium]